MLDELRLIREQGLLGIIFSFCEDGLIDQAGSKNQIG